jgi:hypothetical protein
MFYRVAMWTFLCVYERRFCVLFIFARFDARSRFRTANLPFVRVGSRRAFLRECKSMISFSKFHRFEVFEYIGRSALCSVDFQICALL